MIAPAQVSASLGAWLAAMTAAVALAAMFLIIIDLPPTWAILMLLAALGFACVAWSGNPRDSLLSIFLLTLPVEISKALTSEGSAYSPTLSVYLYDLAFIPLTGFWVLDRLVGVPRARWSRLHTVAAAFLVWMAISAATSIASVSWSIFLNFLKYFTYLLVIGDLTRDPRRLRIAIYSLAAGLALQLSMVVLQVVTGSDLQIRGSKNTDLGRLLVFEQGGGLHVRRPSGFLAHPNVFSDYLTFALPPLMALALLGPAKLRRAWWPTVLLLVGSLVALVLALSRGGWIAFASSALFVLAVGWLRGLVQARHIAALAVCGMLAAAILPVAFPAAIYRVTLSDQRSSDARLAMIDQALLIIRRFPITGVGLAGYNQAAQTNIPTSFASLLPAFRETLLKGVVHNKYLLTFAESGIIGIALFCAMLVIYITMPLKYNMQINSEYWAFLLGLSGAGVAQMVFYLFDHFSYDIRLGLLYTMAALMIGVCDQLERACEAACAYSTSTPTT
ncbi:O-antigen ligase domain-containing protein [Methylobacterium currus]|uniref:O-antigen ligase domain-containing protein n=1 Tax=Methylobacterium currus TaxID=2051553 RepID=A0A2R4WQJ3_9HYPH|nr:O-antigen ligase family protein [Methylobacterium currus]AWB23810.1 O-antigen ligase domain-containing protein [Methylobacterium currus]